MQFAWNYKIIKNQRNDTFRKEKMLDIYVCEWGGSGGEGN